MTAQQEKNHLAEFSIDLPYQSDLEYHSETGILEALKKLNDLNPNAKDYWKLKANLCYCIARNAIEQFSRSKYNAGILTKIHFEKIFYKLKDLEEKAGEENDLF